MHVEKWIRKLKFMHMRCVFMWKARWFACFSFLPVACTWLLLPTNVWRRWRRRQPLRPWIGFDSWWQISEGYFQFRQEGLRDRRGDFLFLPVDTQARRRSEKPVFPKVPREQQSPCGQNCRDCRRRIHPRLRCQSSREWPPAVSVEYATALRCVRRNRPSYFDFTCIRRLLCM